MDGRSRTEVPTSPAPAEILREELAAARRAGTDFDAAWPTALARSLEEERPVTRARQWETALAATRPSWAAAYERRGGAGLVDALDVLQITEEETQAVAPHGGMQLVA